MRVFDLTGTIRTGMLSYGHPLPQIAVEQIACLETEGWKGHRLSLHSLAGTYIETADHLFAEREQIADVPVNRFVNRAVIAQLVDKDRFEPITADELIEAVGADFRPGDALLVATGWEKHWDDPHFITECPFFLPEAMEWVVSQDVGLLGLDIPCVQDPRNDDGELNRQFFAKDRLLLAPLIGLRSAGKGVFTLISLPLNIPGVSGTPCRAILIDQVLENNHKVDME